MSFRFLRQSRFVRVEKAARERTIVFRDRTKCYFDKRHPVRIALFTYLLGKRFSFTAI